MPRERRKNIFTHFVALVLNRVRYSYELFRIMFKQNWQELVRKLLASFRLLRLNADIVQHQKLCLGRLEKIVLHTASCQI